MDILAPLTNKTTGKQLIFFITYRYTNLTWAIPSSKTTTLHVAFIFSDKWIVSHEIPVFLPTDNGLQSVNKFLETICKFFGVENLATPAYHLQTNIQAELYNKTMAHVSVIMLPKPKGLGLICPAVNIRLHCQSPSNDKNDPV